MCVCVCVCVCTNIEQQRFQSQGSKGRLSRGNRSKTQVNMFPFKNKFRCENRSTPNLHFTYDTYFPNFAYLREKSEKFYGVNT